MHAHTNHLAKESSPYLLQHAHNPVDWYPWGEEAFAKAKAENKLVLVSIGYSACHWCHVMEHECFENDSIAAVMNAHFVCVKVDREERPDVDQVYMSAVQLMTGRGGWPLNCFTLPDGRPVYGGTYFPPQQWVQLLTDLHNTWQADPAKVKGYAERLHDGVRTSELVTLNTEPPVFERRTLQRMVEVMDSTFDRTDGGTDHAPKFPMPNNWQFLLRYAWLTGDADLKAQVELTLDSMAWGGIHDQVGGGFARYSVDGIWKVPHFEKMLYDNAQLVSLYAQAYQATKDPLYKEVVERTLAFVERELTSPEGACYSALDADSEGEEGRFYVWSDAELRQVLGADHAFAEQYYAIGKKALWEHGNNILLRDADEAAIAQRLGITVEQVRTTATRVNDLLLKARSSRVRPGLDDKALTSWNALMVLGWCDAHEALGSDAYLSNARRTMELVLTKCRRSDGGLWHNYKNGKATINGYAEDYAFAIEALLALYSITFEERWLDEARALMEYTIAHFQDGTTGMFWFTSDLDPALIARKMEVNDNVIPASNSSLCKSLHVLGHLLDDERYLGMSERMLNNVQEGFERYPSGNSNWAQAMLMHLFPYYAIAITGPEALERRRAFGHAFIPNRLFVGTRTTSALPLLQERSLGNSTTIFVCQDKVCQLPVNTVEEALKQLE
ncbi:MAG: thioredoxin domain-containing protein [Flavobacteriales bacterium]|nr:thioredoxin domain-containing protein [Flavobacteriales bacterium]